MSNVLLVGPFGRGDPAAEATALALCTALADHDVVVTSADPADTTARLGARAIGTGMARLLRHVRRADLVLFAGATVFTSGRSSGAPADAVAPPPHRCGRGGGQRQPAPRGHARRGCR